MTDYYSYFNSNSSCDEFFADYLLSNTILTETSKVQTSADGLLLSSLESSRNLRQPGRATPEVQDGTNGLPLSSLESMGNLRQLGRATPQVQGGLNGLLFSVDGNQANLGMKRDVELVPCNLSVAEGRVTKKQCRGTFFIDESSTLQQPEPKRKELISGKTIKEGAKVLVDRIDRRLNKVYKMMAMKASQLCPQVFGSLEQIETQWPLLSDLQKVKQNIKEILENHKGRLLPEAEAKQKLLQVEKELEQLDQLEEFNGETLEKLYSACSQMKEVGGSLLTREEFQSKFSDLEKEIYAKDNNKVGVEDFPGLQAALDNITGWGKLPNYLEPIAIRIEEARGKATEISQIGSQLLVCAAIKEMENLLVKDLDLDRLKKWGATLNKAKEHDFQVGFADNLLELKLLAYFATQLLGSGIIIG
ncbi:pentafunctional arom polypeptide [Gossypium australe]|uniref:Pentafunctional arom polypeptide n=1 Tax=Gossypium australe TaxID=47621 RepID=A0A5B6VSH1_9ROSI|nr:pentafunctional arom polypeptide [Gossypium australe]